MEATRVFIHIENEYYKENDEAIFLKFRFGHICLMQQRDLFYPINLVLLKWHFCIHFLATFSYSDAALFSNLLAACLSSSGCFHQSECIV